MAKKIPNEILTILSICEVNNNALKIVGGQLDRKTYVEVDKVLKSIGGKWNRKEQAHIFENAEQLQDSLEEVLLTGEYHNKKQDYGQFDTPLELAEYIVECASVEEGEDVLEPSCGIGNIVKAAINRGGKVFGIEIDDARSRKTIDENPNMVGVMTADFLEHSPTKLLYDVVVMNPPFAKQNDIDHVIHAFNFLKPGGRLVSIMSAGIAFRENKKTKEFREFLAQHKGTITPLPEKSFSNSGTNVNTVLIVMNN
jgi:type I restriction-modification system DNA methylase subunit